MSATTPPPPAHLHTSSSSSMIGASHSAPIHIPAYGSQVSQLSSSWMSSLSSTNAIMNNNSSSTTTASEVSVGGVSDEKIYPLNTQQQQQQDQQQQQQQQHRHSKLSYNPWAPSYNSSPIVDYTAVNIPFMEIKDMAIAEQLTCVEYGLFMKLKPRDMLRHVWKTKKGSVAIQTCISFFNFISLWVATMILLPPKPKHRAKMMEKFISIAKILRDMGNYNTTMAIIGALNTSSIHRLTHTRELLQNKEIWNTFKELEHLMGSERSFFEYRAALRATKGPCIPYLGVHLADLLSISEGNKDFRQGPLPTMTTTSETMTNTTTTTTMTMIGSTMLHWQKFVLMTDVINMVLSFQQEAPSSSGAAVATTTATAGYHRIQPDPFISRLITDTHVLNDEELYAKSVMVEPPAKLNHSRSLSKFTFF
ncbi:hypothetical protein BX616_005987 [Lobosporangium transversale]|uniref:Ras guanine nucleotide exchange factor domain-containing protein n=1 Tax=Lobosporangium transversale TaxID=64571 RepID=A0A1Y2H1R0_9FUNG|nr:ras guanine nucleotide exchange factor domain-containing protein [Lobosporangium transversale]KAF9897217.1 hypothetical protein BX616_005987 [Lobosporangium transversale]ORZ27974.1 ras guanine nucleotide exchange factor domain-containing protein [Lobosporangium transversale]|eukprot:XP_021885677.1 ras guanine nucleotide exchange factor domain-containing protein [Lobosporangium transversale]